MRLFVGNLQFDTSDAQLEALFAEYGTVYKAVHAWERETNRPRGYGFVEMPNPVQAQAAIRHLHGTDFRGRYITVREATSRPPDPAKAQRVPRPPRGRTWDPP